MANATLRDPNALVTTGWLERHLLDDDLRVFDCSTVLEIQETGDKPYRVVNCQEEHEAGHIPGAEYLDLQKDFSEANSPYAMTLAKPETVAAAFARKGIGDQSRVILYSRRSMSWSTRFWWMLRWIGFDRAAVLDGGFDKWNAEKRPLLKEQNVYPRGILNIKHRPELFVGKKEVLDAIGDESTCIVNALGRDIYSGENSRYGRPGRVPGSINIPQIELVDPSTLAFKPPEHISNQFTQVGAGIAENHITYCGGGIFATVNAYWLHQLGYNNIAVYENSMSEWGPDSSLPIEKD